MSSDGAETRQDGLAPSAPSAAALSWVAQSRHLSELLLLAALVLITPWLLTLRLTHDVSWQFWVARQISHGVPLYTHIVEINPPLWFWMAVPLQIAGNWLSVAPDRLYVLLVVAIGAWSAGSFGRLAFRERPVQRMASMFAIVMLGIIAPIYDLGQREQLLVLLALPYVALVARRHAGESVSDRMALAVGLTGAFGFLLKHYFLIAPILLELLYLTRHRSFRGLFREETIALGAAGLAYVAAMMTFTPHYFSQIIPLVRAAYAGYEWPLAIQLNRSEVLVWVLTAVSYPFLRRSLAPFDRALGDMLGVATFAFVVSYFAQQKGWQYHALPATVCASLQMVHCLFAQKDPGRALLRHPVAIVAASIFLVVGLQRGPYKSAWAADMPYYLSEAKPGDSVMILTADPRRVFPFVEERHLIWPSRYFSHWMIAAIARAEQSGRLVPAELEQVAQDVRAQTLEDMRCHPPELILSQIRNSGYKIAPEAFRMTDFFRRDQNFRDYLEHNYKLEKTNALFETYRRTTPVDPEGENCRQIH